MVKSYPSGDITRKAGEKSNGVPTLQTFSCIFVPNTDSRDVPRSEGGASSVLAVEPTHCTPICTNGGTDTENASCNPCVVGSY
jgi:hypothetical protein